MPTLTSRMAASPALHLWPALLSANEFFDRETNVTCDLPQERWRDIAARVEGDSGSTSVRMAELLVRPALADFRETVAQQECNHFAGFENGRRTQR